MMAEAVGLAGSLVGIATVAYDSCKKLSDAVQGFRNAPENLNSIVGDLESFRNLLDSLKSDLRDQGQVSSGSVGETRNLGRP
ncbi:hypothetical protein N0V93_004011 [Gnomoniopsis smithogilvyi]|uniref:Azaphilone pigments biosynthesis cluster protein L N-terminal domain-containing protein n=1 Tax=Gnomoniopsis smithogilvyi TaxID=1191159 RepID=A0A9W8YZL4_9PEZI|nr:hypothetical protein N0V93_004011 [Gnomoniopsis smithogilvyi]